MRKSLYVFICGFVVAMLAFSVPVTNFSVISVSADGDTTAVILSDVKKIMFKREGGKTYMNTYSRNGFAKKNGRHILFGLFTTDDGTTIEPEVPVDTKEENPQPIDTLKPIDPIEPGDTLKPIDPIEPADTLKPIDPIEPEDTLKPIEPVEPADTLKPIEPGDPIEPADTLKPNEPVVDNGNLDDNEDNYVNPVPNRKPETTRPQVTYEIEQEAVDAKVKFAIYPNPVENYLTLTGVSENTPVVIYSIKGKVTISTKGTRIDVSHLAQGEYVLNVMGHHLVFLKK